MREPANWISTGIPLVLTAPGLGLMLNLEPGAFGVLVLTMLVGTPAISFPGAIGAALTLGIQRGGLLLSLLILPLYVPLLIFGVSAVNAYTTGLSAFGPTFMILCALSLATVALAPFAAAAALRMNLQ